MTNEMQVPESVQVAAREASNRIERSSYHSRNPHTVAVYSTPKGWLIQREIDRMPKDGKLVLTIRPTAVPPLPAVRRGSENWD